MRLETQATSSNHGGRHRSSSAPQEIHDIPDRDPPPRLEKESLTQRRPGIGERTRSAVSLAQINRIISQDKVDTDTYGVSEVREGFFDALFLKPVETSAEELREHARTTLPLAFDKGNPLSPKHFMARQVHELHSLAVRVATTRSGIRLTRSFLAYFIAYVLCLVPVVRYWMGRYSYIMAVSVILNHPARTAGSQIEGAILTTLGTAAGLGWGVIGLLLSTSTAAARLGFGGVLAMFLVLFMAVIAWGRSYFIKFHQAVFCAGIAITFTTLAETSSRDIKWEKIWSYGLPWVIGQAIALVVNFLVFPDFGARPLAETLGQFFNVAQDALVIPRPRDVRIRRSLARAYVDLSTAYRDFRLEITFTRFHPDDFGDLRNIMQAIIRAFLTMETETFMFNTEGEGDDTVTINISGPSPLYEGSREKRPISPSSAPGSEDASRKVINKLSGPTKRILGSMREGLKRSHAALLDLSGYRKHMGPSSEISSDVGQIQIQLKAELAEFDACEADLLNSGYLAHTSIQASDVVQLFIFARHVREAAAAVNKLLDKVEYMQTLSDWPRVYMPSYPFWQSLHRTNAQVRHDRGGITAGSYHNTFADIAKLLDKIKSKEYKPQPRTRPTTPEPTERGPENPPETTADPEPEIQSKPGKGYKIWRVLHRLQGFESRYAFKVCLVTSLLSVPSYLAKDYWWDRYEVWWVVSVSWIMIHPRVGGNIQDLVTRAFAATLGAVWAGAAYAAGHGSPYVLAVFAAIFMIPMLYRYTQSSHPRSGLVGCLSFTVVSLSLRYHEDEAESKVLLALYLGLSFLVGTVVPVVLNWVLWPFVARHELRFALSSMLFFMSVIYRSTVARYVYFEEGQEPTPQDIQNSEMLEGRLREGFVRIRQLLVLTRHEIRLRAPFDPLPYSALADSCERFFEYLIAVRQSAIFYNPGYIRDNTVAAEKLLGYRRDAVAAILGNLYILAGALRSQRPVPRYLPSAAASRKKLFLRTIEVEDEMAAQAKDTDVQQHRRWTDIYSYSYHESLTGCAAQLEELEKYTKLIVGEGGSDGIFKDDDDESDDGIE